jgi:hypothetical protein
MRKLLAIAATFWAATLVGYIFYANTRDDDVSRQLRNLAAAHLGASKEAMTNDYTRIPTGSIVAIRDIARRENRQTEMLQKLLLASAAVSLCLSSIILFGKPKQS